jgi:hypothetical protein
LRCWSELAEVKSSPKEEPRVQVLRVFLDETVRCLKEHAQGMLVELIFNLKEEGTCDWEDRKPEKVIMG